MKVQRISLGFPLNIIVETTIENIDEIKKNDYSNKNVDIRVKIDKVMKKSFNKESLESEIKLATNANKIRLQFVYDTQTNIRSKEISEQKDITDKFIAYAKLNGIAYKDSLLDKIRNIQEYMFTESFTPHDSFILEYLSIRGAIGILDGQGREEMSFNFADDFSEGIIGITGFTGSGKCITGNSIILTDKGFKRISKYALPSKQGFKPLTETLYTQKNEKADSSHFYTEKVNNTIKIKNALGMELEGTFDHPVLIFNTDCEYEFKKLKDIKIGDFACIPRGMNVFPAENKPFYRYVEKKSRNAIKRTVPTIMTEELARFLGYYVANGVIDHNTISFTTNNKKIAADYVACVKTVFNMPVRLMGGNNYSFTSNQIRRYMSSLFGYPLKTARLKKIPLTILESTKECQKSFLQAYFDCDSSVYKSVFEFCTASKDCSEVIQNMLLNFGIISVHRTKRVKGYNWTYHTLSISSLELDKLMNIILDKSLKYKYNYSGVRNTNIDIIPYAKDFSHKYFNPRKNGMVMDDDLTYFTPCRTCTYKNLTYKSLQVCIDRAKKIRSKKCIEYTRKMSSIVENNYFYSPITDIKINNKPTIVYDFTIPSTHRFYSNGFISHNTTLLENMHPYPCMLTRVGSLKDHFCLPDSHRILVYRCSSGKKIRITMFINGTAKSVMTRYFVETKEEGKSWEPLKSIDGSNESYLQWVNSTFGPKELFMRTSFYPKETPKNFPDLSQATKSEKMELFSVLSGTDYLSVVSEQAKLKLKDEEKLVEDIKTQMKDFDDIEDKMTRYSDIISNNDIQIKEYEKYIETDRASLDEYTEKQKAFIAASATYDIFRNQLTEKLNRQVELQKSIIQIENNIIGLNQQIEDIDTYKAQIEWYDENISKRKELQKQDSELRDKLNTLQAHIDKKQAEIDSHKENYRDLDNKVKDVVKDISMLEKSIPETDGTCPVCGTPLSDHKKEELEKEIETINAKIEEYKKERDEYQTQRDEEIEWLDNNSIQNFKTEQTDTNNKLVEIVNDISTIDSYMESMDIDELRNIVNNSDNNLAAENNRKQETQKELDSVNKTIDELNEKLNNIPEDYSDKITRLQRGIEDSQQNIATLKAEVTMAKTEMEKFKESESKIKSIKEEIKVHTNNIKEYEIIQQAFSNNGIQALELDSAAPEISDIANAILLETYGDRFSISFDTQRDARDGRKIDDFIINVFDAKCGRNKRLDLISSGEGALMKQTLYYAFSVIRTRRTGFCFRTRFLDESDGSLDSALRVKYLRMIEAAHKQCGAVQSFLITHSQELKEIIEQKIEL